MATKQGKDRNALVKCEYCGEYYSVTYKECPFCDEFEEEQAQKASSGGSHSSNNGGKRLVTNTRGGGYGRYTGWTPARIFVTVLSIAIIIAAISIVFTIVKPLIDRGKINPAPTPPDVIASASPSDAPAPSEAPIASPEPSRIPSDQTATGFKLNHSEFSFSAKYPDPVVLKPTFSPTGSKGYITWTSSDTDIAVVDDNGVVYHGTKKGTATITATMAGGVTQTCTVYNSVTSGGSSAPSTSVSTSAPTSAPSSAPSGNLKLNKTDFTLSNAGEPTVRLKVSGTSSTPTWSVKNSSVATVSADGAVTPVGKGTTTIYCSVDGQKLECIVRITYNP